MSREYETAPEVAMGIGGEFDKDSQLFVSFSTKPVLDELLSYGWQPQEMAENATLSKRHPRFKEMEKAGRIGEEDPQNKGMFYVVPTDHPVHYEAEFVTIMRRGADPADVMSNAPTILLCAHPENRRCPIVPSGRCHKVRFAAAYRRWKDGREETHGGLGLDAIPFLTDSQRADLRHRGVFTGEQLVDVSEDLLSRYPGGLQLRDRVQKYLDATKDKRSEDDLAAKLAERDARIAALEAKLNAKEAKPRKAAARR